MSARYQSTKTYGAELGLSACFRQHRATHSHCSLLHGYALSFKFTFEADSLDDRNWVQDFGGLRELKDNLVKTFDHTLCVAKDDPQLDRLLALESIAGIADVRIMDAVGCEAFAKLAYSFAKRVVSKTHTRVSEGGRVRVVSCECSEHGANSAIYFGGGDDA